MSTPELLTAAKAALNEMAIYLEHAVNERMSEAAARLGAAIAKAEGRER